MGDQRTFASMAWNQKGKVTRRERFLAEMDAVIPWARLMAVIEPHYPEGGSRAASRWGWRRCCGSTSCSSGSICRTRRPRTRSTTASRCDASPRVELGDDVVPDETTILRFRHLLEKHGLTKGIFEEIAGLLEEKRLLLRSGTIVDATIIAAPSSTKNASADPRPGDEADAQGEELALRDEAARRDGSAGLGAHGAGDRMRRAADITQLPELLHGQEREVFGDQAYWKEADRQAFEARGVRYRMNRRSKPQAAAERAMEEDQPGALADPGARRACLSGRQATVGIRQGEIPGLAKNLARAQTMWECRKFRVRESYNGARKAWRTVWQRTRTTKRSPMRCSISF